MKRTLLIILFLSFFAFAQGQNSEKELMKNTEKAVNTIQDTTKNGWKSKGTFTLLINQSSFSNWVSGGENNFSGNVGVNYELNYKKDDLSWDNRVIASYGLVQTQNSNFEKKTDDQFDIFSIVGKRAFGNWYYSFFVNIRSQFSKGYFYSQDANGVEQRTEYTNFMSPGYLTFGPGIYWKKHDNLKVNFAPLTSRFTFVDNIYTSVPGYVDGSYFGVAANKNSLYELGFNATAYYKFDIMENVTAENILNLYSNYLKDPQNVDLNYTLSVVMKINKVLSTNLLFQTIYDNDAFAGFQIKEIFGLGVNYKF